MYTVWAHQRKQLFFGMQLPATEPFTADKNHKSLAKKENPGAGQTQTSLKLKGNSFICKETLHCKSISEGKKTIYLLLVTL